MPMATISNGSDRLQLAYLDEGGESANGATVLLIHGFASTGQVNWVNTSWVKALTAAGFRVVAFDNRGHGESTKFHDAADYALEKMAGDAIGLLDFLGIETAHVMGYSMGARIAALVAACHGERVNKLVISGYGWAMVDSSDHWMEIRDSLLAPSLQDVTTERGRTFRIFADQTGSDLVALAACMEGARRRISQAELQTVENPALVAVGTEDAIAGSGEKLAAALPHGRFLPIPGRDHMKAVGDRRHISGVVDFLTE